jgi:hypothetical protein
MWTWVEEWLRGTRPPARRTWRPKIRQRQFAHRQRLYGGGYSEPEPLRGVDEQDMPPEDGEG